MKDVFTISVGFENADLIGTTNSVIQAAVDRAASLGGGTVNILPGVYTMNDSLHLRTGVTIHGCGNDTVLTKSRSVKSSTLYYLGYGHYDVSVVEPDKFNIGTGVYITDDNTEGFQGTVATIVGKQGHELILSKPLNNDYSSNCNGNAVSVYPVISGQYLENACIMDLVVDGNVGENEYMNGCRGGGIFMLQAHNIEIKNVTVTNFNGDGISFQQCRDTVIDGCRCIGNTGHGLHPGSGSVGLVIRDTIASNNGMDGIFFCLRVSYALCEKCDISGNHGDGISIGHRDTDSIIRMNTITNNGRYGIYFRKDGSMQTGSRTMITGNSFQSNCIHEGRGDILIDSAVPELHIMDNTFNYQEKPEMGLPIYINVSQISMVVYGNKPHDLIVKSSADDQLKGISFKQPEYKLQIGPEYADSSNCLHLGMKTS